jgi:molybdopterin-guanine dinucleotide biosynthesis protein A
VIAAVLAGGRSRRMGTVKALAPLGGAPLIARPLAAARAAGLEPVVVAKPGSPLPGALDVPVWEEPAEPVHPLCGVVCALERAGASLLVLACDQPWVPAELLRTLAATDADVALCAVEGRPQPLPARCAPALLPQLRAALAREAPLREALTGLAPVMVAAEARWLAGVNTPEELAAAERALA